MPIQTTQCTKSGRPARPRAHLAGTLLVGLLVAGCSGVLDKSADFDRHRFSRLVQPFEVPGKIYFDLFFPADFPEGDAAADVARRGWLEAWLAQRRLCPEGHEVVNRRPFAYLEDNPAGYQQRWEIRCAGPAATPAPGN